MLYMNTKLDNIFLVYCKTQHFVKMLFTSISKSISLSLNKRHHSKSIVKTEMGKINFLNIQFHSKHQELQMLG